MTAVDYTVDGQTYEGYFLAPEGKTNLPVVAIAHAWAGLGENEIQKAGRVANELGYAAFAMDVYGKGKRGTTVEENQALMNPLVGDRAELQKRLAGGLAAAKAQPGVDASKTAAIGFCFGGLCVLCCIQAIVLQLPIEGRAPDGQPARDFRHAPAVVVDGGADHLRLD